MAQTTQRKDWQTEIYETEKLLPNKEVVTRLKRQLAEWRKSLPVVQLTKA
jgi:predicted dithiol-disulfide oxidoreductase (DUF899 family)